MPKWITLLFFSYSVVLHAEHISLNQHEEGWYWHNERIEKENKKPEPTSQEPVHAVDPDKTWKFIGKMVEQSRAKAILNPSMNNITEARRMQRLVMTQANLFSERWMFNLLLHPELDENLINPNNNAGRTLYNDHNNLLKEQLIAQISQASGLFYFYEGGEPFSERMAEVIREFAEHYQMRLIPIAMTNKFSPVFPDSQVDSGLAQQMEVKHIPAVFAMNPYSKQMMPVAYGLISQSELKENLFMATQAFKSGGYDEH